MIEAIIRVGSKIRLGEITILVKKIQKNGLIQIGVIAPKNMGIKKAESCSKKTD